jgi:glycosyltransferase involved in cell wall biosynthesis
MMRTVHLTSSTFHGGPERQMLGLAQALAPTVSTAFLSFNEGGRCREFLDQARRLGFEADALEHDTPHLRAATHELTEQLRARQTDVLFVHGYKAGLLGRIAARRAGIPVVAVSRGWTHESLRVKLYELLDRINLRWMDRVVCVSRGQAAKVRKVGVSRRKIVVIPNAINTERFDHRDASARLELERLFSCPPRSIVGAAGRLSPEKGFHVLVDAAAIMARANPSAGFVIFGEGALRDDLRRRIDMHALRERFVLAGFRRDLDRFVPELDLMVQSSFTEGMPNVVLEACAAGVAVVATSVGGTPEIIAQGSSGFLVPPGSATELARRIVEALGDAELRLRMGIEGKAIVAREFTFAAQASRYQRLCEELLCSASAVKAGGSRFFREHSIDESVAEAG